MKYPGKHSYPASKEVKLKVDKLRRAVAKGKLDQRDALLYKLIELSLSFVSELNFEGILRTVEEMIELTDTLIEEGQIEYRSRKVYSVLGVMKVITNLDMEISSADRSTLFNRLKPFVDQLSDDEYYEFRNDWAVEVHGHAERIEENGATVAAIAMLDEAIQRREELFDDPPEHFVDWRPLLDCYYSRGLWKHKIGDRLAAIDDLVHYQTIAQKAGDLLSRKMRSFRRQNSGPHDEPNRLVIRFEVEDYLDFVIAQDFYDQRYCAAALLADFYGEGAEKQKALEQYDQALKIVTQTDIPTSSLTIGIHVAPAEIPFRKGSLLYQFHDYHEALEEFDLAQRELEQLLNSANTVIAEEDYYALLESRLNDLTRFRADTLRALGRFDEAEKEIDTAKRMFVEATQAARRRHPKDAPKQKQKSPQKPEKSAPKPALKKPSELTESDLFRMLGAKHNEAMADVQRGVLEMERRRCKTALKYFLKARIVVDSTVIHELPEAQKNLFGIYHGIARAYLGIQQFEESEMWYRRSIKQAESLIDAGRLEFRELRCEVEEALAHVFFIAQQFEKAYDQLKRTFDLRNNLIEMQEEDLKGLDREQLRVRDNQRLMPLAILLKSQVRTIRLIEEQLCELDRKEEALAWARKELEFFEQMRTLLLDPKRADAEYLDSAASLVTLLLLQKQNEEADALVELWTKKLVDDHDESLENAKLRVEQNVLKRLFQLVGDSEQLTRTKIFCTGGDRAPLKQLLGAAQSRTQAWMETEDNPHRLIRMFWEKMNLTIKNELELANSEEANSPKTDDIEDDDYKNYERNFVNPEDNTETMLQLLSELSGRTLTAKDKEDFDRQMDELHSGAPFGRNEPCPCGSGKKYKKCCGR